MRIVRKREEIVDGDRAFPVHTENGYARIQRHQRRGRVQRVNRKARSTPEYSLRPIITVLGIATGSSLEPALERSTKVLTPRFLTQASAEGCLVSNLG